jgi:hypothetical protein
MKALSFLLMALASIPGDPPPPPSKREPEPEPSDPTPERAEWKISADYADAMADRCVFALHPKHQPRQRPLQFPPWAPSRRVADPGKKRARKAQKKARRAGR